MIDALKLKFNHIFSQMLNFDECEEKKISTMILLQANNLPDRLWTNHVHTCIRNILPNHWWRPGKSCLFLFSK